MNKTLILSCILAGYSTVFLNAQENCSGNGENVVSDSVRFAQLEEVVITSRKPMSIVKADRITYQPSEMISTGGANIYDVLMSIPGLSIDGNGIITINGENGVGIYVDGRKSILTGEMLISFLKSLSASNIDKIEILTVPGAKRDASEAATVINLQKKRRREEGFGFGINSDNSVGKSHSFYGNGSMEFYRSRHYLSLGYSGNTAYRPSNLFTLRPCKDYNGNLRQNYNRERYDIMHNIALSYDYQLDNYSKIGTVLNYNYFRRREPATMTTFIPDKEKLPTVTTNTAYFINKNIYGGVYFKRILESPHTGLNISLDFFNYDNYEEQFMKNNIGEGIIGDMSGRIYGIVGAADWESAISPHWHLSTGARISYVEMNNYGVYEDSNNTSGVLSNDDFGSHSGYRENVNAGYIEARANSGILSASLGVRMEQSNTHNAFSGNESSEPQDYSRHDLRVYPSMSLLINFQESGSWALSYSKKITRPRFSDLDPFIHIFDDITHVGGNVNLKGAISHSINLSYSNNSWLRIGVSGTYASNEIVKCYQEITDKLVYVMPENLPRYLKFICSASVMNIGLKPWWTLSVNANVLYSNFHFPVSLDSPSNVRFTPIIDVRSYFNLPYGWSAELNASYRGKTVYGQAEVSSSWNSYLGFRKPLFNNKLNLVFYVKDILNTNYSDSKIVFSEREALLVEREFENMRRIGVSLSFRFDSGKRTSRKENRNSCVDEMNRVNL